MKKLLLCAMLMATATVMTGCLRAPVIPPTGAAFSDLQAPLDVDYDSTAVGGKRGSAESISVLGLVALGDASAGAAAQAGGINTINHADYEYFNVFGVFQRYRTIVYGQ